MKKNWIYFALLTFSFACATANEEKDEKPEQPLNTAELETNEIVELEATSLSSGIEKDLTASVFKSGIENEGILLIDVRTPEEFASGSIEGAVNIDFLADNFAETIATLEKDKPVYIFCKSGGRSGQAKTIFIDQGFAEVYNLIGGYSQWPF